MMREPVKRESFVFESTEKEPVERTMKRLNDTLADRTYSIDFDNGKWYIFEVEDEDEI